MMNLQEKILDVKHLCKYFKLDSVMEKAKFVKAVDDVSLTIYKGETYGLVGESGCGKSTLGRCILRLIEPTKGEVHYNNENILTAKGEHLRNIRGTMQMVFQDPYMSLDPKKRVGQAIEEALKIHGIGSSVDRFNYALDLMLSMGFHEEHFFRYPYQFSGGQRQRIGLARALILKPKLIICDEPVSALDVSVQAQIINMMKDIQDDTEISYLFITHNLSVVRYISHRVGVMYLGNLVEEAETEELFNNYHHPYTEALLSAVAEPNPHVRKKHIVLKGEVPSPLNAPKGCVFCTRCPYCTEECKARRPQMQIVDTDSAHKVACFHPISKAK